MPYILVVDDDPALLRALPHTLALRMSGIKVDTCDSALEALALLHAYDYDAIVSDIKMPGMDGLALLEKIQELRPNTPTLLISGHGEHNLAVQALRGGAYDLIQKPIDRDYFIAALNRAIHTKQLRKQVIEQQKVLELHALSLEELVQVRTQELMAANAAKDEFLSLASHELKTPLATIKALTQLLQREYMYTSDATSSKLQNMERSIHRMEVLVNDLLNTSLVETGMFTLHRAFTDLNALCRHVCEEYLQQSMFRLELEAPDEPLFVEVDENRISQVLINLLSNAHKYSAKGSLITVRVTREEPYAVFSVSDQGVGIPQNMLSHLFDRFFRVPGVTVQTGSSVGLGLGLYIARMIIERHDGIIEAQSVQGQGSTFRVLLPLVSESAEVAQDTL